MTSIAANDDADEEEDEGMPLPQKRVQYTAPKAVLKDITQVCYTCLTNLLNTVNFYYYVHI